jgi:unsaturated chondroitin disaccharide hydrolase
MPRAPEALVERVTDQEVPSRYAGTANGGQYELEQALSDAIEQIDDNRKEFYDRFPTPSSTDLFYERTDNTSGWTTSFWTGQCWLAYEVTGEDRFRDAAETQLETFHSRLDEGEVATHDLGFLYTLSAVAGHQLTGRESYSELAVAAADLLSDRYLTSPGILQAWDTMEDPDDPWNEGRMIVDTMMNLPLLFRASEITDDERYASIAETHARTNAEFIVRSDGSTQHTFQFDTETGAPLGGETHQGHDDNSCWARGQAWAIYGYALTAQYTDEGAYLELAANLANYYLDRLESNHVPLWDFDAPSENAALDTSAAAIAACALDELARQLPCTDDRAENYRAAAIKMLGSLAENYTTDGINSNGLLTDGAYNHNEGDYDECCIWGDYFYVEGLVRATEYWSRYW